MSPDAKKYLDRVLEDKAKLRRKLAALPIGEKLRILDRLREAAVAIKAATPLQTARQTTEDNSSA